MDKIPATYPKGVSKILYESLRKKYYGKGKVGESTNSKLLETDENNDNDDTGSESTSEMADRKGKT